MPRTVKDSARPPPDGKRLPQLARWRSGVVATYTPPALPKLDFTLAARYSDRMFATIDNSDHYANTYQGFGAFFVMDAHVRYKLNDHLAVGAGVDNLNGRKCRLPVSPVPATDGAGRSEVHLLNPTAWCAAGRVTVALASVRFPMNAILNAACALALATMATAASAHVVVQPATAVPGSEANLDFVVGHGCSGQPTTALRVELPSNVKVLMPDAKPGWSLDTERLPGGGRALTWHGGEPLTKAEGFTVKVKLPATAGKVSFVAAQTCGPVTVRWDEPVAADGGKPKHPAPTVTLAAADAAGAAMPAAATTGGKLPQGVQRLADGTLADAAGKPLYTWDIDTMVGMSHCETDCAAMWPPLKAPKNAKPMGDWSPISREDGSAQWTYKTKPLYTYSGDTGRRRRRARRSPTSGTWQLDTLHR